MFGEYFMELVFFRLVLLVGYDINEYFGIVLDIS